MGRDPSSPSLAWRRPPFDGSSVWCSERELADEVGGGQEMSNRGYALLLAFSTALLVMTLWGVAWSQCPEWSETFDRLANPEARRDLEGKRGRWDQLFAEAGGPARAIVNLKYDLSSARDRLEGSKKSAAALEVPGAARPQVNWALCTSGRVSAITAARCETLNMQELVWTLEGMIDLAQCRLNR